VISWFFQQGPVGRQGVAPASGQVRTGGQVRQGLASRVVHSGCGGRTAAHRRGLTSTECGNWGQAQQLGVRCANPIMFQLRSWLVGTHTTAQPLAGPNVL